VILVLGDIAVDIVSHLRSPLLRGSDAAAEVRLMPGGSGANVAVWLARVGAAVTLVGRVGDDAFGRWLAEDLQREGVAPALAVDRALGTAVIQVLVEPGGERTMVPDRGANAHWTEADVAEELVARAELLHVVGYVLLDDGSRAGALQAMEYARAHGVPISLDPSSHGPLQRLGAAGFWSLVGDVSVLLPNRAEAQALTGTSDTEAALELLHTHAPVVAIKLDRDGCLAAAGEQRWSQPAPPTAVVNATGAGDAFDAAFLARWLVTRDLAAACLAGVTLGSHAASLPATR
jgi:ribokinase